MRAFVCCDGAMSLRAPRGREGVGGIRPVVFTRHPGKVPRVVARANNADARPSTTSRASPPRRGPFVASSSSVCPAFLVPIFLERRVIVAASSGCADDRCLESLFRRQPPDRPSVRRTLHRCVFGRRPETRDEAMRASARMGWRRSRIHAAAGVARARRR